MQDLEKRKNSGCFLQGQYTKYCDRSVKCLRITAGNILLNHFYFKNIGKSNMFLSCLNRTDAEKEDGVFIISNCL